MLQLFLRILFADAVTIDPGSTENGGAVAVRRSRECEGHKAAIQIDLRGAQVIQQDLAAASAAAELTVVVSQQHRSGSAAAVLALQLPAVGERLHTVDLAAGGKFFQRG